MTDLPDFEAQITALETKVWQALVEGDIATDEAMLDDGFLGVYADGFAKKTEHAGQLSAGPSMLTYELSDLQIRALGPTHVLISYCARFQRVGRQEIEVMYVSSIWEWQQDQWRNIFSQDTPAEVN